MTFGEQAVLVLFSIVTYVFTLRYYIDEDKILREERLQHIRKAEEHELNRERYGDIEAGRMARDINYPRPLDDIEEDSYSREALRAFESSNPVSSRGRLPFPTSLRYTRITNTRRIKTTKEKLKELLWHSTHSIK